MATPSNRPGTEEEWSEYVAGIIAERNRLLLSSRVSRKTLRDLFIKGLDGEEAEDFPELTLQFYKGLSDPIRHGRRMLNEWMREGG